MKKIMTQLITPTKTHTSCPYWDRQTYNECTMYKAGLFLPLDEHVAHYCKSTRFQHCQQYLRGCAEIKDTDQKQGLSLADSRRTHDRLQKKFPLRVYVYDSQGKLITLLSDKAETINLSAGGLGILSPTKLETGQQIAVHFNKDFTIPDLSSKGTIRWCKQTGDQHYQAGIAFANDKTGQVMADLWQ